MTEFDYWLEYDVAAGTYDDGRIVMAAPGVIATTSWHGAYPIPFPDWFAAMKQLIKESHPEVSTARLIRRARTPTPKSETLQQITLQDVPITHEKKQRKETE